MHEQDSDLSCSSRPSCDKRRYSKCRFERLDLYSLAVGQPGTGPHPDIPSTQAHLKGKPTSLLTTTELIYIDDQLLDLLLIELSGLAEGGHFRIAGLWHAGLIDSVSYGVRGTRQFLLIRERLIFGHIRGPEPEDTIGEVGGTDCHELSVR